MQKKVSQERLEILKNVKKIVLKLGTKVILTHNQDIEKERINQLISEIVHFQKNGYTFVIVSSGAVGLGMSALGLTKRPKDIKSIQALAAIGQNILMQKWHKLFKKHDINIGQILLTYDVIEDRKRFLNTRNCFNTLFDYNVIPIVNENDSVSIEELKFGDNDTLSSFASQMIDADLQILFTDTDGVYNKNPQKHKDAKKLEIIEEINSDILSLVEDKNNDLSTGGMTSKLKAAKISSDNGTAVIITDGCNPRLKDILEGKNIGTLIKPKSSNISDRKKWIFFNQKIKGKIFIDKGAEEAVLKKRKSILPSGITTVAGKFNEGDLIGVYNLKKEIIAKGLVYHSSLDVDIMKGKKTKEIKNIFPNLGYEEIIDRNNLIILKETDNAKY